MPMSGVWHWHPWDWAIAGALAALAWSYLRRAVGRRSMPERAAFVGAWLTLAFALLSPFDALAQTRFWFHMLQHELIMAVAAPLLVLATPLPAVAQSLPRSLARLVYRPLRFASPLAATLLHALALWVWHAPRLFDTSVADETVHAAQHASFFFTAVVFWWMVVRHAASGAGALCLLATMIHTALLGALLTFAPAPLYAGYALDDQQLGGLIMWVPAGFVLLGAGLLAFDRWLDCSA